MSYDPNMEEHLNNTFPDPRNAPWNQDLSHQVGHELRMLPQSYLIWVHEDGRIFIDSHMPLSDDSRKYIESVGYNFIGQSIGMGRVQYQIARRD